MLGLDRGALAVDLGIGIGEVQRDEFGVAADRIDGLALAALFQPQQDVVFHLDVPAEIILAGLDDGARGRDGIAAALHLDRVEVGAVRHVVVGIELAADDIARLELDEFVGAGADGGEVVRGLAGLGAFIFREQMFRDDAAGGADKGVGPERRRLLEQDADREVVDLLDGDVAVNADGHGGGGGIAGVFPVEHHVIGGEGFAVVPFDAGLQLPGHRRAVGGQPAILDRGNLGRQNQLHVAVRIPAGERLIEQARAVLVLGAGGEMRIEQGRSLPPQQFQRAAAAALGRLVDGWALGHGHAADGQNLRGHGRGETESQHPLNEAAAIHAPVLHFVDHGSQFVVQHRCPRVWFWSL